MAVGGSGVWLGVGAKVGAKLTFVGNGLVEMVVQATSQKGMRSVRRNRGQQIMSLPLFALFVIVYQGSSVGGSASNLR